MTLTLDKPDILEVVQQYTNLRKAGKNYSGLCPFHDERTPSFIVNADTQRFKCFGCGAGGDVLDFVQQVNGCDFKSALSVLGIDTGKPFRSDAVQVRKRELEKQFREWEREYFTEVSAEYRLLNQALDVLKNTDDMADLYKRRTILEYHLDILSGKEDTEKLTEKLALFQAVRHE